MRTLPGNCPQCLNSGVKCKCPDIIVSSNEKTIQPHCPRCGQRVTCNCAPIIAATNKNFLSADKARELFQVKKTSKRAERFEKYLKNIHEAILVAIENEKEWVIVSARNYDDSIIDDVVDFLKNKRYQLQKVGLDEMKISWASYTMKNGG